MAKDTYLEMVSNVILETGLNGGVPPSSISAAAGDAAKVVYWLKTADLQIQRERIDWDFLWGREDAPLTQGSAVVPSPVDTNAGDADPNTHTVLVNTVAKDRLAIIDPNGLPFFPQYMDWDEFSVLYGFETPPPSDYPAWWTIRPDRVIVLSEPIASNGRTCRYEFWRKPIPLRDDDDVSRIPDDFSRIIVVRTKIMYAEHEDAPEVDVGAAAEYDILLNQMVAIHTPRSEWQRLESSDQPLMVRTL